MGVFILIWCISGILMIMPSDWFGGSARLSRPDIDYRNVMLSPAEAISRLEAHTGVAENIKNIQLQQIHHHLVYQIRTMGSGVHRIDGVTGDYFEYTAELAEDMARNAFKINAPLIESTRLTEHDSTFPFGQLPAYRMRFDNEPDVNYFVIENNARIRRSTNTSLIAGIIMSLHTLEPVEHITNSRMVRDTFLYLTGGLTLLGAIIGYIMTLPAGRKKRRAGI